MKTFVFLCLFISSAIAQNKLAIAVNDFAPTGVDSSTATIISDRLRSELMQLNVFRMMERSQMDLILKEQGFQQSGACNSSQCEVEVGQLLGVDRIIMGTIGKIDQLWTITARLINVETGEVLLSVSEDFEGKVSGFLKNIIPLVAQKVTMRFNGQSLASTANSQSGILFVDTDIEEADVWIDGVLQSQKTPLTIKNIFPGSHTVKVQKNEHKGEKSITIQPNELLKLLIPMQKGVGELLVLSEPPGADVIIQGKNKGKTPVQIANLEAGEHLVTIKSPEHLDLQLTATVSVDKTAQLNATLRNASFLSLNISPDDALITLDSTTLPHSDGELTNYKLPSGTHLLNISHEDYESLEESIHLNLGEKLFKKYSLKKKEGSSNTLSIATKIVSAAVFVLGSGYAVYQHYQMKDYNEKGQIVLEKYDMENGVGTTFSSTAFRSHKSDYLDYQQKAADAETQKYVGIGIAGIGTLGFVISFQF